MNRAALMLAVTSCGGVAPPRPPAVTPTGVRFVLAWPDAGSVAVAGSFNQWSPASHPLSQDRSQGTWTLVVPLPPGEHLFMYVVDGTKWITPPLAEDYVDDGFRARNGIVVVRPAER